MMAWRTARIFAQVGQYENAWRRPDFMAHSASTMHSPFASVLVAAAARAPAARAATGRRGVIRVRDGKALAHERVDVVDLGPFDVRHTFGVYDEVDPAHVDHRVTCRDFVVQAHAVGDVPISRLDEQTN